VACQPEPAREWHRKPLAAHAAARGPLAAAAPQSRPALVRRRASGASLAMQVLVRDNDVEFALRQLKRKLRREGVFRELKRRRAYEKPSERRTREKGEAMRRRRKALRKRLEREGY
jgi:small subunit ribosomal protein S21